MQADGHIVVADYVSDQLTEEARRSAERHLSDCEQCRAAVEAARRKQRETASQPPKEVSRFGAATLRLFLPRMAQGLWKALNLLGRFGVVAGLTAAVLLLPAPEGITPEGHRALALLVFTASILALEPVSLPLAALMVPLMQVALGLADTRVAFEPFSRPVVFLVLTGLFLAEALRKHGLTRRLALLTIIASGGGIRMVLLALMGTAAFFSMWIENTATAAMLIPVALTLSRQVADAETARRFLALLVLGIAYSASIGGMGTVMGAASNAVTAGFLAEIRPWRFMDWMRYGLPAMAVVFPLTWWLLLRMVPVPLERLDVGPAQEALGKQGRMNGSERELIAVLLVAIFLWISGEFWEIYFSLPPTLLSAALIGIGAVAYLGIRGILNWDDMKGVSWGLFFIIGAGLSLGDALVRTGVTDWFASLVAPVVSGWLVFFSLLTLVFVSALATNLINNTTITALFVPVLITLGRADPAFDALQFVLPVALATTFGYSLPSASGRMALIAASGIVPRGMMMRVGLKMTLVSSLALGLYFYLLILLDLI